jgi:hypothetical protein
MKGHCLQALRACAEPTQAALQMAYQGYGYKDEEYCDAFFLDAMFTS